MNTFGLLPSDSVIFEAPKSAEGHSINPKMFEMLKKAGASPLYPGTFAEGSATYGAFFRCDRGNTPTDHHTFFIISNMNADMAPDGQSINPQLSHASFEVSNLDDVWRGHMQLKTKAEFDNQRYDIAWGVGRHVLGSHIYDYWHDPYGHVHEHMSDGDRMTRNFGQRIHKISGLGPNGHNQWGPTVKESGIRNLDGPAAASFFKDFDKETQQSLINRDLSNVEELVEKILKVEGKHRNGVGLVIFSVFNFIKSVGGQCRIYIPDRITEGYGPNTSALLELARAGASVVITVDCGTVAYEPLIAAADAGIDVVVVDHHVAEENLPPAVAVVNPNRFDDASGVGHLAAVGVVFLLVVAINRALRASGRFIVRVKIPSLKDVKRCSWALGSIFKDIELHPLVKIVGIALTN